MFVLLELRAFLIICVPIRFFFAFLGAGKGRRYRRDAEGAEFWEAGIGLSSESGAGLDCGFFALVKRRFMARLAGGSFLARICGATFCPGSTAEPDKD